MVSRILILIWGRLSLYFIATTLIDITTTKPIRIFTTFSSDQFYDDLAEQKYELLLRYGIPCVEMECAELFTLGSRFDVETLGILTVSDMINDEKACSAEEREKAFTKMMQIALDAV